MSTIQAADVPTLNQNTTGSAATATSATSLNSSNFISQTGSSGNFNTDFSNTPAGTYRYNGDSSGAANNPGGSWWLVENMRHTNSSNLWGTQIAWGWEDNANRLATRNVSGGSFGAWVYYLNTANYTSVAYAASSINAAGATYLVGNVTGSYLLTNFNRTPTQLGYGGTWTQYNQTSSPGQNTLFGWIRRS
jgi:hypothetical protein